MAGGNFVGHFWSCAVSFFSCLVPADQNSLFPPARDYLRDNFAVFHPSGSELPWTSAALTVLEALAKNFSPF